MHTDRQDHGRRAGTGQAARPSPLRHAPHTALTGPPLLRHGARPSLLQLLDDDGAAALDAEVGEGLGVVVERLGDLLLGVGVGLGLGLGYG